MAGKECFPSALKGRRILLATESLGPVNGVSRTTLMLIEYLRENGAQVAVVAPQFDDKGPKANRNTQAQIRLHGYPLPYNPDLTVAYPFRLDTVFHKTFVPDVIYLASPASVGFQFLLQIRQLQEPPVVLLNFQTDLSAYSEIILPALLDRFAVWLLGAVQGFLFSHRAVHTIFYPSAGIRDYLENAGAPTNKLVRLGRGVDTTLFNPSQRDEKYRKSLAPNGETILVCVCRIAPEKGFRFLAEVAAKLVKQSFAFKLVIVGGNRNPSVEDDVHRLFEKVKDHVIFTGFLTGVPLARAYASGDIFLHCSVTETFGLVVLEAMASGLPVIARDQGGPSEIVQHEKTGYLVQPHDVDDFTRKVLYVAKDSSVRSSLASVSRQVAEDTTWEKINKRVAWSIAEGLEKRSKDILARKSNKPIRNWFLSIYHGLKFTVVLPMIVTMRLHFSIALVALMWIVAVVPLILHGNAAFLNLWRGFYSMPTFFQRGYNLR